MNNSQHGESSSRSKMLLVPLGGFHEIILLSTLTPLFFHFLPSVNFPFLSVSILFYSFPFLAHPSVSFLFNTLSYSSALTEVFSNSQVIRLGLASCDSMVVCLMSVRNEKFALGYQFHKSPRSFTKVHD